jgi:hypothetical protein
VGRDAGVGRGETGGGTGVRRAGAVGRGLAVETGLDVGIPRGVLLGVDVTADVAVGVALGVKVGVILAVAVGVDVAVESARILSSEAMPNFAVRPRLTWQA